MTQPVRVRRLTDEEGRQVQRIVRRGGGGTDKSIVKWRRALVVQASAGGNTVSVIARLVATSEDRVREMIHRFNELGMRSLDPQWAGGRPRQITTDDVAFIVATANTRPEKLGQPFTRWSIRKLIQFLAENNERVVVVGRERCRQILVANEVTLVFSMSGVVIMKAAFSRVFRRGYGSLARIGPSCTACVKSRPICTAAVSFSVIS